jgi:hypothetical protein
VGGANEAYSRSTPGVGSSIIVGDEAGSRQGSKEEKPVVAEPARGEIEGEDDVAAEALKHLQAKA